MAFAGGWDSKHRKILGKGMWLSEPLWLFAVANILSKLKCKMVGGREAKGERLG